MAKFYDHLINVFKKDDRTFEDKIIVGGDFNDILNYLLILSKLCIWECRRANCSLNFKVARLDFLGAIPPKLVINYVAINNDIESKLL